MSRGLKPRGKNVVLYKEDHAVLLVVSKCLTYEVLLDLDTAKTLQIEGYSWSKFSSAGLYFMSRQKGACKLLHRLVAGAEEGEVVDHIDGNTLNNQRNNLRKTNQHINGMNRRKLNANNKSGVRGVHFNRRLIKWVAEVRPNNKKTVLGYFTNKDDAIAAVSKFMRENFNDCGY